MTVAQGGGHLNKAPLVRWCGIEPGRVGAAMSRPTIVLQTSSLNFTADSTLSCIIYLNLTELIISLNSLFGEVSDLTLQKF
jgi:hypothetical protein